MWQRFVTAIKIDIIPLFDVRPARNALETLCVKLTNLYPDQR